jgi:hypothetical protein
MNSQHIVPPLAQRTLRQPSRSDLSYRPTVSFGSETCQGVTQHFASCEMINAEDKVQMVAQVAVEKFGAGAQAA